MHACMLLSAWASRKGGRASAIHARNRVKARGRPHSAEGLAASPYSLLAAIGRSLAASGSLQEQCVWPVRVLWHAGALERATKQELAK